MLKRTAFFDVQDAGGLHFWAQCDIWNTDNGTSRRVDFQKLDSWSQCRLFQQTHGVEDRDTGVDIGHHRHREVFAKCCEFHWIGYRGDDKEGFPHYEDQGKGKPKILVFKPWSEVKLQDSLSGKAVDRSSRSLAQARLARTFDWSNPYFYPIFYALKNGEGRYYGIARDISKDYIKQINSMMPKWEDGKLVWTQNGPNHGWDTSCGNLVMAMHRGFFRIEDEKPSKPVEEAKI